MKFLTTIILFLAALANIKTSYAQNLNAAVITGLTIENQYFPNNTSTNTNVVRHNFVFAGDSTLLTVLSVHSNIDATIKVTSVGQFVLQPATYTNTQFFFVNSDLYAGQTVAIPLGKFNYYRGIRQAPFTLTVSVLNAALNISEQATYFIYNDARPLPVTLVSFNVKSMSGGNALVWKTASENNFDHFDVEYSENGVAFTKVGEVKTKGGTLTYGFSYNFFHSPTKSGSAYYRLKSIDLDGSSSFSPVQVVNPKSIIGIGSKHLVKFQERYFSYDVPEGEVPSKVTLMDMLGRVLLTQTNVDTVTYNTGQKQAYLLRLTMESGKSVSKLVFRVK